MSPAVHLRAISPAATPDEVAAIVAAIEASTAVAAPPSAADEGSLHEWVHGARLQARRSGLQRGPWRLSARLARRSRS